MQGHNLRAVLNWMIVATIIAGGMTGCVTEADIVPSAGDEDRKVLLIGRVVTVLTGERARRFEPVVRQMEFVTLSTGKRYNVTVDGQDKLFAVFVPPGRYEINRVQISEGPFLSISQLSSTLTLEEGSVVFVGTWRFGVDSPRYGRMLLWSMVLDDETRQLAQAKIREDYPNLAREPFTISTPVPAEIETRLYEVMPYPRYPKYFQRHLW